MVISKILYPWLCLEAQRKPAIFCHFLEHFFFLKKSFMCVFHRPWEPNKHVITIFNHYNLQIFHILWNYVSVVNL